MTHSTTAALPSPAVNSSFFAAVLGADASRTAPYGVALLRVALGVLLMAHGLLKVLVFTLPGTAAFFASVGFPAFTAYLVAPAEILGGLALIAGFKTRWVAAAVLPILVGALFVHAGNGWLFSAKGGGWEFPALLLVATLAQVMLGSGALAVDNRRAAPR